MIQLRYFASLRETLGIGDETVVLQENIVNVSDLTAWLRQRGDIWDTALSIRNLHVAINHEIATPDTAIQDGDEVAWFPPVTGG